MPCRPVYPEVRRSPIGHSAFPAVSVIRGRPWRRTARLVGRDFCHVRRYPEMVFRSASTTHEGGEGFRMSGDLTIRDVTRPVDPQLDYLGSDMDPFEYERAGFDGTTTIDRTEWGLVYDQRLKTGGAMVSEKVRLRFDISAIRSAS